ncbi:MAG: cytochrome c biogenesis protein CcsA [Pseudomonadales bacterium]
MNPIYPGAIAVVLYLIATALEGIRLIRQRPVATWVMQSLGAIAVIAQAITVALVLATPDGLDLGLFAVASLVSMIVVMITLLGSIRQPMESLFLLVYPLAAACVIASLALSSGYEPRPELARGIGPHALLSIVAYSILTLAACQALMFAFQEHRLHTGGSLALLRALPPLATMEVLLFQLLWTGLIVLTASIITGFVFLEDMFAQHVVHHTALSLSSWVIFAILLWGHHVRGWRGVTAIRWTLTGFVLLMLAYFGSKLVIEIILDH